MDLIAPLYALLAGALFGLTAHVQRAALQGTEVSLGALLSIATMAGVFWVLAPLVIDWSWFGTRAAVIFGACGLLFPAMSQRLQIMSVVHVGPTLTSAIGAFAPLFAVLPAILFLGEVLSLQGALGMGLMLAGLLVSAVGPGGGMARGFPVAALLLPLGASAARGITQPAAKFGFAEVNDAFFATMMMATVSTVVLALWYLAVRARRPVRSSPRGNLWFVLNGFVIGAGILALQAAISRGSVTIAAPLASTTPLWTMLMGVLYFRTERLTWRHLAMALLVVAGAALVVTR